jgi:hypothetical protein
MPYPTLYFVVELEFNVAYLHPNEPREHLAETRGSQFEPSDEIFTTVTSKYDTNCLDVSELFDSTSARDLVIKYRVMEATISKSICEQLRAANIPTRPPPSLDYRLQLKADLTGWGIEGDMTIRPPDETMNHRWMDVELASPAYEFNAKNMQVVQKACCVLTTNYLTNINASTGCHVLISFRVGKRWTLYSLEKPDDVSLDLPVSIRHHSPQFTPGSSAREYSNKLCPRHAEGFLDV